MDNKIPFNSCFLLKEEINFPKKVSSSKNSSIEEQHNCDISFSNNLNINKRTSSFSGFGISMFS